MPESPFREGFYAAFMAAQAGEAYAVLVIANGLIVGADPLGVKFDGYYQIEAGRILATLQVIAPPGGSLIQGLETGPAGLNYSVSFPLPFEFDRQAFIAIETPFGPVNAKFQFLRGMSRE